MLLYNPDIIEYLDSKYDGITEFYDSGYRLKNHRIDLLDTFLSKIVKCIYKYAEEEFLLISEHMIEINGRELYRPELMIILEEELDESDEDEPFCLGDIGLIVDIFANSATTTTVEVKRRLSVFSELGNLRHYVAIYLEDKAAQCWSLNDEGFFLTKSTKQYLNIGDFCAIPEKEIFETRTLSEI